MDKQQLEQLKKLVMDLDKNLTRLKSFIDQHESEPGFGDFKDSFGNFPPAPTRRNAPFSPPMERRPLDPQRMPVSDPFASITKSAPEMPKPPVFDNPVPNVGVNAAPLPTAPAQPQTNTVLSPNSTPQATDEVEGTFDGQFLVSPTGVKVEIPASYASKSRILYGDTVKAYKENGEQKFKITIKQPRKQIKALTTKREGKWYVVSGLGSYKISDSTADFNQLQVNQEVNVLVPESNTTVPFAAFDEIATTNDNKSVSTMSQQNSNNSQNRPAPQQSRPAPVHRSQPVPAQQTQRQQPKPNPVQREQRPVAPQPTRQPNTPQPANTPQNQPQPQPSAPIDPALKIIEDFDLV